MRKAFSIPVLVGAVTLLQVHGIVFWTSKVGSLGIFWSILLEAVALWLWYQPSVAKRILGLTASLMLLSGPLHLVAVPVIQGMEDAQHADAARLAKIHLIQEEISGLEKSLETFRRNSEVRAGWLNAIQESDQRLTRTREELAGLLAAPEQASLGWSQRGIVLMQGAALVLFQITAILIVTTLSPASTNPSSSEHGNEFLETKEAVQESSDAQNIVQLSKKIEEYLTRKNLTAKKFAEIHKLNPRDVSLIRNHSERSAAGKQVVTPGAVHRITKILDSCS